MSTDPTRKAFAPLDLWAKAQAALPVDVVEFGQNIKMPEVISEMWRAAYVAGMRAAMSHRLGSGFVIVPVGVERAIEEARTIRDDLRALDDGQDSREFFDYAMGRMAEACNAILTAHHSEVERHRDGGQP